MSKDKNRRKKMASDEEIEKAFNSVRITLVRTESPKKTTPTPERVSLRVGDWGWLSNIGRFRKGSPS